MTTGGASKSAASRKRIAVLGTGSAGFKHLRALRGAGIGAIAVSLRPERRSELRDLGFETAADLREAAAMGAKACIVATDTSRHAADAVSAARNGMDVLVEKPFAPDARQARLAAAQIRRAGRLCFVGCVMRFSASLGRFRSLLPKIGRIHAVDVECRSYLPDWRPQRPYRRAYSARAGEGGVLRDLIHEVDYAGWIFGFPKSACGRTSNLGRLKIDAEETADLFWTAEKGFTVSLGLDYLTRPSRRAMRAFGERGTLEWDALAQTTTLRLAGKSARVFSAPQTVEDRFTLQARAFAGALNGLKDIRLATAKEGIAALAVCDAARRNQPCAPSKI